VVADQSTDATEAIVAAYPDSRVQLIRQVPRAGQTAGLRRGARAARGEILLMADASGRFYPDTVRQLARHFADPRVGGVSGRKRIAKTDGAVSKGDGFHFGYDGLLRAWESRWGSSWVGCQGGLFAIRRPLFSEAAPLDIAADNAVCYELYEQGYRHHFDPAAVVLEAPSRHLKMEFQRKVRIIVLQLRGVRHFRRLFHPLKHPAFFFQNVSHKIFRWLQPFALIVLWIASGFSAQSWARVLFYAQCLFYAVAVLGMLYARRRKLPKRLSIPAYFVTVNLAGLTAWARLLKDYTVWTPPAREDEPSKNFSSL
jgi:poly-beta-1,6-N-acetyl-D-glucosamine synthase